MVFSSSVFLFIFLPMVLFLYYLPINNRTYKNIVLLFASLLFYAWGEPFFVFVMLLSILINYLLALKLDKANGKKRKTLLAICVVFDIGLIFVFKYLGFAVRSLAALFNADWSVQLALPIGISFFTFQIMSYVFDVYYGNAEVQRSYLSLALYISMFPQLIAGPIVRYNQVAEEIRNRKENLSDFSCGFARFTIGLAKKVLLANYIALVADNIFAVTGKNISIATAWLGAVCYGLQIYFDFSIRIWRLDWEGCSASILKRISTTLIPSVRAPISGEGGTSLFPAGFAIMCISPSAENRAERRKPCGTCSSFGS